MKWSLVSGAWARSTAAPACTRPRPVAMAPPVVRGSATPGRHHPQRHHERDFRPMAPTIRLDQRDLSDRHRCRAQGCRRRCRRPAHLFLVDPDSARRSGRRLPSVLATPAARAPPRTGRGPIPSRSPSPISSARPPPQPRSSITVNAVLTSVVVSPTVGNGGARLRATIFRPGPGSIPQRHGQALRWRGPSPFPGLDQPAPACTTAPAFTTGSATIKAKVTVNGISVTGTASGNVSMKRGELVVARFPQTGGKSKGVGFLFGVRLDQLTPL